MIEVFLAVGIVIGGGIMDEPPQEEEPVFIALDGES